MEFILDLTSNLSSSMFKTICPGSQTLITKSFYDPQTGDSPLNPPLTKVISNSERKTMALNHILKKFRLNLKEKSHGRNLLPLKFQTLV